MASTIVTKNSSTASAVPVSGDLTQGELAVNVTDKRLFTKNSGGTVVELGTTPTSLTTGAISGTTLAASGAVTFSGGTANGVAYLNGSKVVTTGSALTFDGNRLTVSSTTPSIRIDDTNATGPFGVDWYFSGAGGITRANISLDGSTGEMQFQSGASGSSGWFQTFVLSGSEQMRLTSTGLGIGTSSPSARLSLFSGTGSSNGITLQASGWPYYGRIGMNGTSGGEQYWTANYSFATSAVDSASYYSTYIQNSAAQGIVAFGTSNGVNTAPTERARIDSSGNLLLGTTSSTYGGQLTVRGATTTVASFMNSNFVAATSGTQLNINAGATTGNTNFQMQVNSGGGLAYNDLVLQPNGGNLLVGTTSVPGGGGKITVSGDNSSGRMMQLIGTTGTDTTSFSMSITKNANDSTTSQRFIGFLINAGATGSGQINANGASQAAFGSFSDQRLKENISDLTPQLSKLMALRPVEFDYKDGSGHQTGFIAQEMQQIFPDAVGDDGSEDKYLTITGWNKTEAILVKAIQEQQSLIETLTARITALEGK